MSHSILKGTLASAVADAATITPSYPVREGPERGSHDAGSFIGGFNHKLNIAGASLVYPDDFDISFGATTITVTNKTGATWAADSAWVLQLDIPGKKVFAAADERGKVQIVTRTGRSDVVRVLLGAPDILDANGICASQSIAAGTASTTTSATLDGALASVNAVTGLRECVLDVPRAVDAAWTTTSVVTIVGKDEYGNAMVESSASGTSLTGKKAFKVIDRVYSSVAITSATVGTTDVLGLPLFLQDTKNIIKEMVDGAEIKNGIFLPYQFTGTDLYAATPQNLVAPIVGTIRRHTGSVTAILADTGAEVGDIDLTVNASAVTGSTLTSFTTNGAVGSGHPSVNASGSANAGVVVGDVIVVTPSAAWASAGAIAGVVEIVPTGESLELPGTFVAGMVTAGGSTATTADVRGTYDPASACDGSLTFELLLSVPDAGNRGAAQLATAAT